MKTLKDDRSLARSSSQVKCHNNEILRYSRVFRAILGVELAIARATRALLLRTYVRVHASSACILAVGVTEAISVD